MLTRHWEKFRLCVGSAKPVNAKVYRLRVKVPAELIGEIEAIPDTEKKE